MARFTSIQAGDEKQKVPAVTSDQLGDIASRWKVSKATAAEIIIARQHGHLFGVSQAEREAYENRIIELEGREAYLSEQLADTNEQFSQLWNELLIRQGRHTAAEEYRQEYGQPPEWINEVFRDSP